MKVVIPVAGIGTRLRPHTHTAPKVLLPVAGKPILGHILDELKAMDNVEEIAFVVGYRGDMVREYVNTSYQFKTQFVTQEETKGLGHAIWMTRELYANEKSPLLIVLGDTIFQADFSKAFAMKESFLGVKEVDDPRRFGLAEVEGGYIKSLVEKPEHPKSNLALVGIYYVIEPPMLYKALDAIIEENVRMRGEFQLTDALARMLKWGYKLRPFPIEGWHDCGKPETMLETNRVILKSKSDPGDIEILKKRFSGCIINPPVSIGKDVSLENSIVGPYVTVSEGSTIRNAIVSNSILAKGASVQNVILESSIISDNAKAEGHLFRLNVGDSSEINF
ncbi:MAG: sugar phosphate nucleotidyltransferase [bacterium]